MKFVTLIFFLLLVHLEALGVGNTFLILPILLLLLLVPKYYSIQVITDFFLNNTYFLILLIVLTIGVFRANYQVTESNIFSTILSKFIFLILFVGIVVCISYYQRFTLKLSFYQSLNYLLILPAIIYFSLNLFLHFLGVRVRQGGLEDQSIDQAVFLSKLGININRVQFPLATGLNNYAFNVALIFLILLFFIFILKKRSIFIILSASLCLLSILMVDTRVALFIPILLVIVAYRFNFILKYSKTIFLVFLLLGPVIYLTVVPYVSELMGLDTLARSDDDLQTGNFRLIIWGVSFLFFSNFDIMHLFGYGEYGHFGSGQSVNWSYAFTNIQNSSVNITPHSSFFTIIYDYGYIGLLVYIIFFFKILNVGRQEEDSRVINRLMKCIVIFVAWAGTTDTIIGFYFENFMFMLFTFIIVFIIYFSKQNSSRKHLKVLKN